MSLILQDLSGLLRDYSVCGSQFKPAYFDLLYFLIYFLNCITYGLNSHLRKWPDFSEGSQTSYMEFSECERQFFLSVLAWTLGVILGWSMYLNGGIRKPGPADSAPYQGEALCKSQPCLILRVLIYKTRIWMISKAPFSTESLLYYPQIFVIFPFTLVESIHLFQHLQHFQLVYLFI